MIREKDTKLEELNSDLYLGKWIHFGLIAHKPKTTIWGIYINESNFELGKIFWNTTWRQYVFKTIPKTMIVDDGCLTTIAKFLDILNEKQQTANQTRIKNEKSGK